MSGGRIALWIVAVPVVAMVMAYISSIIFFIWQGFDPDTARPWSIIQYAFLVYNERAYWPSLGVSIGVPMFGLFLILIAPLFKAKPIYGDARWATESDLNKAGLRDKSGVLLGKKGGRYLCSNTATHTLLVGPTRAGKGTGVVVPNCLNWGGSLVVLDVKGENFTITSGFRAAHGHKVFFWSPMSKDNASHRFNPLDEVSADPAHRVSDVQVMASLLIDVSDKDPMWGLEARALFVAVTLYVLEQRNQKTLGEVYRVLASDADLRDVCRKILTTTPALSPEASRGLGSFAAKSPKEASSVRSNLQSALRLFENPVVDAATSASDFSIRDLRSQRMSIYVGALASQLDALAPLLRLFFQQTIAVMSEKEPGPDEPHEVLMIMDEFASLGTMDAIASAFTLLAGFNVRILAVLQGLSWLDRSYGRDTREGMISCCGNQIFMTTNDETTTAYVSQGLGERTVATSSTTRKLFSSRLDTPSRNTSQTGRPLMSKQEVRGLDRNKQIIMVEGHRPALAKKIRYFADTSFKKRLLPAVQIPALSITAKPTIQIVKPPSDDIIIIDDGGPIVDIPDAPISNDPFVPASPAQPASEIAGTQAAAFAETEEKFFAVVQEEMNENPHFKTAHQLDIKELRDMDVESVI